MAKIKKVYDKGFTVLDNSSIDDAELTWKAKGLFTYLWRQPDNWNFYAKEVSKHAKGGISQVYSGLDELEEHGYLHRQRNRNQLGQLKDNSWELSDRPKKEWIKEWKRRSKHTNKKKVPNLDFPNLDNPDLEKPDLENRTLLNTIQTKDYKDQVSTKSITSLSFTDREEREVNQTIEILIDYLNGFAERWRKPPISFSKSELNKLRKAIKGKDISLMKDAAEKTVIYGEQYPQGYLISCISNLPDRKSGQS